jgi:hypothetical protein
MRHQGSRTQYQPLPTGEASVSFEFMSKAKSDRFRPPPLGLESLMVWQIEWFGNEAGDFQVFKLGQDAFSLDDARVEFLLEMADAERSLAGESEKEKRTSPEPC